ncbi:Putative alpha-L-arabinofuranosidase B, arabinose-binding domain-containing protein [Septoria linicola]|uniref:Alpha-L-arabinofuranosidase n=1 Tax=Septoria linicola TaxID=215465 RepID=A0A9Q9AJU2_9PEZI|nr:putative alpha-L-arabinofuranosidase B, arabinose-binding domain-containing protein [Septoria linicola]USW50692.1 Putative alpha-L-arabinofuranosidase B, arabinose-binding domain-containing protein [Septoria linicola]
MLSRSDLYLALSLAATSSLVHAGPCDIYASGNTPCVAAHSTTRALYDRYNGPLYQISRGSDGRTTDILPLAAGGVANAATQDNFCASTTCLITIIYDQSGRSNHLTQAPPGGAASGTEANGFDQLSSAVGAPVTLNGKKAYGVFIHPGSGYRINNPSGIATGDQPEGMYAVLDGTHYNDACCFDYGNAETNNLDTGNGHMEAIYYGTNTIWGTGAGNGPWLMADLENGLFSGANVKQNTADPTINYRFFNAIVKGQANNWALRGANAVSGGLSTYYNGKRPNADGYNPMSKEGAILLGIGGDNSNGAQGTFYEGVMTSGFPSDATENSVQSNIAAAKYATTALSSGPALNAGSTITIRATTPGYNTRYISHSGSTVNTQVVTTSSSTAAQNAAKWTVRAPLAGQATGCVSFESVDTPGSFLRHFNFQLQVNANDNSKAFTEDATFCGQSGLAGQGNTIRAWGYPTRSIRHFNNVGYIARNGGPQAYDSANSYNNDATFVVGSGF